MFWVNMLKLKTKAKKNKNPTTTLSLFSLINQVTSFHAGVIPICGPGAHNVRVLVYITIQIQAHEKQHRGMKVISHGDEEFMNVRMEKKALVAYSHFG